ncbi:FAD-dependent oxidoreductase [Nocardioides sp. CFH 31398]|uniref:FAD-dependent oxidoreductase n=1 Tax=Nocardioides sp. CFH 31398 TaxID=2919579 RepID=UPI001F06804B|nr:FAD-dependent oxidoreductase [Nocardioides sp. CFH 31398]MCH1867966.1 FAD-dependent oxidoreductase [Nocardioides sp. CFH 31398]
MSAGGHGEQHTDRRRVAVVGSGVAGLTAAYVLSRTCHVTLLEADSRLGGHADTHPVDVRRPDGTTVTVPVDTGFIVHNERTYPHLLRLFGELGVTTRLSEMSMSIRDEQRRVEWAGALGLTGVFATWRNAVDPAFLRMLVQVPRFHRRARALLRSTSDADADLRTLAEFLDDGGFDQHFRALFMEPLVAAVWSTDDARALEYPARYLFRFLSHHGMLQVFGSPPWRTVVGGSATYVAAVAEHLDEVRTGVKVTGLLETADGVQLTDGNGERTTFDAVVVATHPHQALAMLDAPTDAQREVLGAITYSTNTAQLHTDTSLLPRLPRARASWNYLRRPAHHHGDTGAVTVTYDLTRLMRLDEAYGVTDRRFLVTLGGADLVDEATVIDTMEYEHPLYTPESVAAQGRLDECDSDRLAFAGAYHGWGFHEDGARSGVEAAARLGVDWERTAPGRRPATASTSPRTYATTISHTRRTPLRRTFSHRSHTQVVDLDHLPRPGVLGPVLGTFEARDHVNDPAHPERSLRENVEAFCAQQGVDVSGGRILMAANPRAFGYCFNPISVFWCFGPDGEQRCVVVEVHNTYGERHAYLVHPDAQGRASTDKALYVSPFHGTGGRYEIAVPTPTETDLHVAVSLTSDEGEDFSASLRGTATARHAPWRAAPVALRHSVLIRLHGITLWLRRLPVRPRPDHPRQEGVS